MELIELATNGKRFLIRSASDLMPEKSKCIRLVTYLIQDSSVEAPQGFIYEPDRVLGHHVYSTKAVGKMSDIDIESLTAMFLARSKAKSRVIEPDKTLELTNIDNILSYIDKADRTGMTSAELVRRCKAFRNLSLTERDDVIEHLIQNGNVVELGKNKKGYQRYKSI